MKQSNSNQDPELNRLFKQTDDLLERSRKLFEKFDQQSVPVKRLMEQREQDISKDQQTRPEKEEIVKYILCIDDDDDSCELIKLIFQQTDYEVTTCIDSEEGLHLAKYGNFAAIIADYRLQGIDGLEFCRRVRNFNQHTPIIFCSGDDRNSVRDSVLEAGAQAYLIKPVDIGTLKVTVISLIEQTSRSGPNSN